MYYLNYFRDMLETYTRSSNRAQNSIAIDQTSVPLKPLRKSMFVIHKGNQYSLERKGILLNTKLNVNQDRLPVINAKSLQRAVLQRNPNFKHTAKRKFALIDTVLKSDVESINSNEVESNDICATGVNKTCVFKRSAKFQPSENITKLLGSSLTNVSESGYKSNIDSQSVTTRIGSDLSSLMDNRQTNTSSQSTNINMNEPQSPAGTKVRHHNKRSSQPRGEPRRSSRRSRRPGRGKRRGRRIKGLSLWIDSKQVKTFSGESTMSSIDTCTVNGLLDIINVIPT